MNSFHTEDEKKKNDGWVAITTASASENFLVEFGGKKPFQI